MSDSEHNDSSNAWLIFFFLCFAFTVLGLGVWACFNYDANAKPDDSGGGGGHGMRFRLPGSDLDKSPDRYPFTPLA